MLRRTVIKSQWYYDEKIMNLVAINSEDKELSKCKQIEVTNKHGSYIFDCAIGYFVPRGAIALNDYQRREYRLKTYHSYYVKEHTCNSPHTMSSLLNEKFNFKSKVGGADAVFEKLSYMILPRLYPQSFVSQTGMRRPRGVLLSGPPGTGKTLIASTICEIFNIQPKIIRGPEIFSRFLGESEGKIRALFADARRDQQTLGEQSKLHILIFDELDSICKHRTHCDESTHSNVQDNVTTQLLTEIDGITPLDNILIIGTTNMIATIDPALLRPGRIELVIEVSLPDTDARIHIFDIYTKELLQNGLLESDVDIDKIIRATRGLTGAHIERLVRLAIINAMRRDVLSRGRLDISEEESKNLRVRNIDFTDAIPEILYAEKKDF
jgi:vesicle-fusing ATPase